MAAQACNDYVVCKPFPKEAEARGLDRLQATRPRLVELTVVIPNGKVHPGMQEGDSVWVRSDAALAPWAKEAFAAPFYSGAAGQAVEGPVILVPGSAVVCTHREAA